LLLLLPLLLLPRRRRVSRPMLSDALGWWIQLLKGGLLQHHLMKL
jgi:hypothetical protein